ncbi:MAG: DUF721 domain-containing protein [Gammaproteobacteria bacterium]|nr:DUF721 domain-containing protein [Gammaproteobacteria bacterium]
MTKFTLNQYLNSPNKTLGPLLIKLNQLTQWNEYLKECLIDKPLTQHCYIVNLDKNALIVIVDSAHWSTRLKFHIPDLLKKLRHYPGLENVRAICCKIQPAYHAKAKIKMRRPSPLSKNTALKVHETAQKITDKNLKKILEKIALQGSDSEE